MPWRVVGSSVLAVTLAIIGFSPAWAADSVWDALRGGGKIVMLRHASTEPGLGDPPGFRLGDCATQRNLSEAGRAEARRIGAAFVRRAVPVARVLSSRWCRCVETARLAFGRVEAWSPLDSFFDDRSREPQQTRRLRALIAEPFTGGNLILVTHQVNITALTGIAPAMGEIIVLSPEPPGSFKIVGRLGPADFFDN
jgi:broad specificity phosphatase PhoE